MERNIPKITDGEMHVLEVLWEKSPIAATEIVSILKERINWNRNTTYTFINRLVDKQVVKREDPGFVCTPLFTKDEVLISETNTFLDKIYNGSLHLMVSRFIENKELSRKELDELRDLINKSMQ
jgi:predicted transcriptional regulator